jgi:hypothetical protein
MANTKEHVRPRTLYFFWLPGLIGIVIVGVLIQFHLTAKVPFVEGLLVKPGAPGFIAGTVMVTALWALTALLFRRLRSRKEMKVIKKAKRALQSLRHGSDLDKHFRAEVGVGYTTSLLRQRFLLLNERLQDSNRSDRAGSLMAGQSSVDAGQSQRAFGPLRALIWALPALGFMGTAFEMANAVGGLGDALGTTKGYDDLRQLLVNDVIPHLAGAFDITLFALGSSVVCFFLLSLVVAHDEDVLNEADSASLQMLAQIEDDTSSAIGIYPLINELQYLTSQVKQLNTSISQLLDVADYSQFRPSLEAIESNTREAAATLLAVDTNLREERVIMVRAGSGTAITRSGL